jgi:hypothetical protein
MLSNFIFLKMAQEWSYTRFVPPNLHDWHMFIKPEELQHHLRTHGLQDGEMVGLSPTINPIQVVSLMHQVSRKHINFAEFGSRAGFQASKDLSASYMGYAIKPSAN